MKSTTTIFTFLLSIGVVVHGHVNYQISTNASELGFHLESPKVTDFGSWGEPEFCPYGQVVTGYQLQVEPKGSFDDTALNGIRFFCDKPTGGDREARSNITSKVGHFGNWGTVMNCSTYAVGFELQSQEYQGRRGDDVAAVNLKLYCADTQVLEAYNDNGHSFKGTTYTGPQMCSLGKALCGLQTQVERYQIFADDSALNNIRAKCCSTAFAAAPFPGDVPVIGVTSPPESSTQAPSS